MRPSVPVIIAALPLLISASVASGTADLPGPVPAVVLNVIDGDTVRLRARIWPQHEVTTLVRLAGIDAPELNGRCAQERRLASYAADALRDQIMPGETVFLFDVETGKYAGRVVARLTTNDGTDAGQVLLRAGLVRLYDGGARQSWCNRGLLDIDG